MDGGTHEQKENKRWGGGRRGYLEKGLNAEGKSSLRLT